MKTTARKNQYTHSRSFAIAACFLLAILPGCWTTKDARPITAVSLVGSWKSSRECEYLLLGLLGKDEWYYRFEIIRMGNQPRLKEMVELVSTDQSAPVEIASVAIMPLMMFSIFNRTPPPPRLSQRWDATTHTLHAMLTSYGSDGEEYTSNCQITFSSPDRGHLFQEGQKPLAVRKLQTPRTNP